MIEPLGQNAALTPPGSRAPSSEADAARQFEEILVRQLVSTMTASLFKESLAEEGGTGWMAGHAETQREVLTDALAQHLMDSGTLRLSDLMARQWAARGSEPGASTD